MERLSRDQMLMEHASIAAKRGTCSRLQVGAVFSREGRILTTGYNGAPKGRPHCKHYQVGEWEETPQIKKPPEVPLWVMDMVTKGDSSAHYQVGELYTKAGEFRHFSSDGSSGCPIANHAERNGIDFAARHGISLEGSELHVTHMPCPTCAGSLLNVGVKRVVFKELYRVGRGVEMLAVAGVEVVDFSSKGR